MVPWVDATLPTIADRDHRAIAGLSQGGYGAMHGAALHPDEFTSVASFSGAPEIYRNPLVRLGAGLVIEGITVGLDGKAPFSILGDAVTNAVHWQGHDPGTLVDNLRGMDINLWTATGLPGDLDTLQTGLSGGGNVIEALTHLSTMSFAQHLSEAKIPYRLDDYVFGTHSFPYWARDLRQYLPILMNRFARPSSPAKVGYTSVARSYSAWGWNVRISRSPAERLTTLAAADARGFDFTSPAARVVVRISLLSRVVSATANSSGRLSITVPGSAAVTID